MCRSGYSRIDHRCRQFWTNSGFNRCCRADIHSVRYQTGGCYVATEEDIYDIAPSKDGGIRGGGRERYREIACRSIKDP